MMRERISHSFGSLLRREKIGPCTLYLGDCGAVLPELKGIDAVVTDPPYGVGMQYRSFIDTRENVQELIPRWLPWCRKNTKRVVFTPGIKSERLYPDPDWTCAWFIGGGGHMSPWGFGMWQPILCYGKDPYLANGLGSRPDTIYTALPNTELGRIKNGRSASCDAAKMKAAYTARAEEFGHPCPKPKAVWDRFIERFSLQGETVLDPFMGSGTTALSCIDYGRKFVGIEVEPKYFELSCNRIKAHMEKPSFTRKTRERLQLRSKLST